MDEHPVVAAEPVLAEVSLLLATAADDELDEAITAALGLLAEAQGVDRAAVVLFGDGRDRLFVSHEWRSCVLGTQVDHRSGLPASRLAWTVAAVERGEEVHVARLADLPAAAVAERTSMERAGIRSYLHVPMSARGRVIGWLAFARVRGEGPWSARTITLVHLVGDAIATALARRRAVTELRVAREQAEEANRAKSVFLSRMSHELRTPLNAILGFAELLSSRPRNSSDRRELEQIVVSGRHLLGLLEDVLDISRVEAGEFVFAIRPVSLDVVVRDSIALVALDAAARGVTVRTDGVQRYVAADRRRLQQVLVNLLSNAVKYNSVGGSVLVSAAGHGQWCRVEVTDTGPGISPVDQARLFEPFDRLGAERTGVVGTGIGLTLTRRLVEQMGGSIGVTSVPGHGSTFWFELPARAWPGTGPPEGAAPLPGRDASAAEPLVLCVDPSDGGRLVLRGVAERVGGLRYAEAATVVAALERLRAEPPAVVVVEPEFADGDGNDGWEVLDAAVRAGSRVVVLTGTADAAPADRARAAGAVAVVVKPAPVAALGELLSAVAAGAHTPSAHTPSAHTPSAHTPSAHTAAAQRKPMCPVEASGVLLERADSR